VSRGGTHSTRSVEDVLAKKNIHGGTAPDRVAEAAAAALESLR
jgi:hypothetical protein